MSAEVLREAATLMRSRAEAATPGPWVMFEQHGRDHTDEGWSWVGVKNADREVAITYPTGVEHEEHEADAEHIASWHPAVALAVADWLEHTADDMADNLSEEREFPQNLPEYRRQVGTATQHYSEPFGESFAVNYSWTAALAFARTYLGRDA